MKEREVLNSLKRSIDQAPIDLLESIKKAPRTKMLRHDEITEQKTRVTSYKKFMPYASIAAAFVMVFAGWQFQTKMPDSQIYIDVNPSVEITTNRMNKVIDLVAHNLDGKVLTDDLTYKGKTIDQVAEEVLDRMIDSRYLHDDNKFLLLSVYNKNGKKAETQKADLDKKVHEYLANKDFQPIVLSQNLEKTSSIENFAKEHGVSISKMAFIRNMIVLNPDLETSDLVDLSIEELVRLSQGTGLKLDKIIDSIDFDKIQDSQAEEEAESESEIDQEDKPIKPSKPLDNDDDDDDDDYDTEDDDDDDDDDYDTEDDDDDDEDDKDDDKDDEDDKDDDDKDDDDQDDQEDDDMDDEDDDDEDDDDEIIQELDIISTDKAKNIALSVANGKIRDFDLDDDDLEYKVKIELEDVEYEITIDARTGAILEVEIDD